MSYGSGKWCYDCNFSHDPDECGSNPAYLFFLAHGWQPSPKELKEINAKKNDEYGIPLNKPWRDVRLNDEYDDELRPVGTSYNLMDWQAKLQTELGTARLKIRSLETKLLAREENEGELVESYEKSLKHSQREKAHLDDSILKLWAVLLKHDPRVGGHIVAALERVLDKLVMDLAQTERALVITESSLKLACVDRERWKKIADRWRRLGNTTAKERNNAVAIISMLEAELKAERDQP